jgi:transcription initiation factor IIE alpha subunit
MPRNYSRKAANTAIAPLAFADHEKAMSAYYMANKNMLIENIKEHKAKILQALKDKQDIDEVFSQYLRTSTQS